MATPIRTNHKYVPRTNEAGKVWVLEDTLVNYDPLAAAQVAYGTPSNAEQQLGLTRGILKMWSTTLGMTPLAVYNYMQMQKPRRLQAADAQGTIELDADRRRIVITSKLVAAFVDPQSTETAAPEPAETSHSVAFTLTGEVPTAKAVPAVASATPLSSPVISAMNTPLSMLAISSEPLTAREQLLVAENQRLREQLRQVAALL